MLYSRVLTHAESAQSGKNAAFAQSVSAIPNTTPSSVLVLPGRVEAGKYGESQLADHFFTGTSRIVMSVQVGGPATQQIVPAPQFEGENVNSSGEVVQNVLHCVAPPGQAGAGALQIPLTQLLGEQQGSCPVAPQV